MEKLTPDLLPFRVYIQVRVTEALKSRYASDGGQGLGVTCYGCAFQRGMASQMLGGMQEYTKVPRAEEWAPPKPTLPSLWILNITLFSVDY